MFVAEEAKEESLEVTRRDNLDILDLVLSQVLQEDALPTVQSLRRHNRGSGVMCRLIVLLVLQRVELERRRETASMIDLCLPIEVFPVVSDD